MLNTFTESKKQKEMSRLNTKIIGNKITEARKQINISQAQLAERLFISSQAVSKWERGESMPDIITFNRLSEILGVDLNYFSERFQSNQVENEIHTSFKKQNEDTSISKFKKNFDWNWDMSQGNWVDADFSGLKNLKEKFSSSNMKNCTFMNSDLSELILGKNNIELCNFSGSNIRDSQIQSSNLLKNQFIKCSFIDAELFKSNIEKCNFTEADFSGAEILESNLERNNVTNVIWKFTKFKKANISNITFSGTIEDCYFEHCSFYGVKFENATILNTFFKYNSKFKKVQFINCVVDKITYAFLKNNEANLSGINLLKENE